MHYALTFFASNYAHDSGQWMKNQGHGFCGSLSFVLPFPSQKKFTPESAFINRTHFPGNEQDFILQLVHNFNDYKYKFFIESIVFVE